MTVREAMRAAGFDAERFGAARGPELAAYLALHVEQGPVLEEQAAEIGVVTSIVGIVGLRARFVGQANHAGTTPMRRRRDALAGAARAVLALRDEARRVGQVTANVGVLTVEPGGSNVIPGAAELTIDVRSAREDILDRMDGFARSELGRIAEDEGLGVSIDEAFRHDPVQLDPAVREAIASAAAAEGARWVALPSGAGHDAMALARRAPAGMIFVPSRGGISHSPEEHTPPELCALGASVLARAVESLAAR